MTRGGLAGSARHETHGQAAVTALARRQHGVVSAAQLAAAGMGRGQVASRLAAGWMTRLHRGVYLVGTLSDELTPGTAALLACGWERSALSHGTAAALWGLWRAPRVVDVSVTAHLRSRPGIRVHRTAALEGTVQRGLRVTTPARTLSDLAAILAPRELERIAEEAQVQRLLTPAELAAALPSRRSLEPKFTRSEAERRLLELVRAARLPEPRTNVRVGRHEVDFLWPRERLVVEVDGFAFHSTRAAFERDRRRDAELQAAGYRVIRVTWRRLVREPEAVVAELAAALALSAPV